MKRRLLGLAGVVQTSLDVVRGRSMIFFFLRKSISIFQTGRWHHLIYVKKNHSRDFPGDPVVKISPFSAGVAGLIPAQGTKIPHAYGQ